MLTEQINYKVYPNKCLESCFVVYTVRKSFAQQLVQLLGPSQTQKAAVVHDSI